MQPAATPAALRPSEPASLGLADGVVRDIDPLLGRVTLRHGPIENLGIPAMSMIFWVRDLRMIQLITSGAAIRFAADRVDGKLTIVHLERK